MAAKGVGTVRNILLTFLLIGVMTAFWRASGTIAVIVCSASGFIRPSVFLLMTFLLNCGVSVLTGTSLGTAATMGVICSAIGATMKVSPLLIGGAVLSGAFFGDRCSPVSTSALLVAAITDTDIYDNIRRMLHTALAPFLLTCLIYAGIGFLLPHGGEAINLEEVFSRTFRLSWVAVVPAFAIFLLSVLRVKVKFAMSVSILAAIPICIIVQKIPPVELLRIALTGFSPKDAEVAAMISGGGIFSMVRVLLIVCLSSSYSGIFQKTGLLDGTKHKVSCLAQKTTVFFAMLVTSVVGGMIACNQTLTILLTEQICRDESCEKEQFAVDLEDSAVVVAPLIPWSIAGGVPLAAAGVPVSSILASFYLFLLPLFRLVQSIREKHQKS